ncbi:MAG: peptidoglycan recognition family protein [Planctomycetota bacterium]
MSTEMHNSNHLTRTRIVWATLVLSMTIAAGLLFVLNPTHSSASTLAPAVSPASMTQDLDAIWNSSVQTRESGWDAIVIHHSATPLGSAETLARRDEENGIRGLGMHFVIGNGQGSNDGLIEIGYRWDEQLPGAHTVGPQADVLNRRAVGICLIGNGESRPFTNAQYESLAALVASLQEKLDIPAERVVLHRDVAGVTSPGRLFREAAFRQALTAGSQTP